MSSSSRSASAVLLVHFAFVLNGIVVTMLGPLVPILSARWSISDAAAGSLFTAQFTVSTLGVALSSVLLPRRGFRFALALGLFWMAIGVVGLSVASWPAALGAVAFYGAGFGIAIPTGNILISKMYPDGDTAALNLLNMSWGIGAIVGPIAIAAFVRAHHISAFYWCLAGLLIICGAGVAFSSIHAKPSTDPRVSSTLPKQFDWTLALLFGSLFFLYVGSENAFSGWVAAYAKRISQANTLWALAPSFFWAALISGRGLAPLVLRRFSDREVASGGLVLACIGSGALVASHHMWTTMVSALIAGIGFAPVYPIVISRMSRRYGDQAQRVAGFMFALAGFGGAVMPWMVGFVADECKSLRLGLIVPLVGALVMLVLQSRVVSKPESIENSTDLAKRGGIGSNAAG